MATGTSNDMIEITGLWRNTSKSGKEYLKGYFGQAQVFIFFNENKTSERAPDARLMIAPKKDDRSDQGRGGRSAGTTGATRPNMAPKAASGPSDDDIPF